MTMTTNIVTQSMGVINMAAGRVVTNADAAAAATFNCGFKPRRIEFHNLTDRISQMWHEGEPDGESLQTIATGVRTLEAATGPTLGTEALGTVNSFTMPAGTMVASKTFAWVAYG